MKQGAFSAGNKDAQGDEQQGGGWTRRGIAREGARASGDGIEWALRDGLAFVVDAFEELGALAVGRAGDEGRDIGNAGAGLAGALRTIGGRAGGSIGFIGVAACAGGRIARAHLVALIQYCAAHGIGAGTRA
jgi:hypothetical protein